MKPIKIHIMIQNMIQNIKPSLVKLLHMEKV